MIGAPRWPRISLMDLVRILHLLALVVVLVRTYRPTTEVDQ